MIDIPNTASPQRLVLFDFDYTLADSTRGVVECANYALRGLGFACAEEERIRRTVGMSLTDTCLALVGTASSQDIDSFAKLFVERADHVMAELTTMYEDVPRTINTLRERGYRVGIVSTKFRYRIGHILRLHDLESVFDLIVGGEDVVKQKPEPDSVFMALQLAGNDVGETVYVGDSLVDAETCRRAGIPFIAVLTGTTSQDDFDGYEVSAFLWSIGQLCEVLA